MPAPSKTYFYRLSKDTKKRTGCVSSQLVADDSTLKKKRKKKRIEKEE